MLFFSVSTFEMQHCHIYYGVMYEVSELWCSLLINQSIGAVNTVIRRPTDGKLIGYNTDCEACITAIEDAMRGAMIYFTNDKIL